jgi:hypothetical protein
MLLAFNVFVETIFARMLNDEIILAYNVFVDILFEAVISVDLTLFAFTLLIANKSLLIKYVSLFTNITELYDAFCKVIFIQIHAPKHSCFHRAVPMSVF